MPQFDSTALRVDATRELWERADDVICFTDLILRWPYYAIINIAYELHANIYDGKIAEDNPPLALYLCDDVVIGQAGEKTLRLRPVHINTPFDPLLRNIPKLAVLRRVVERLEAQHPNYAGRRPLKEGESRLLLATQDNLKEISICILKAWHRASLHKQKIKADGYSLTSDFWTEVRTSTEDLFYLVPEPSAPAFATPEEAPSNFSELGIPEMNPDKDMEYEKHKERARKFVQQFSLNTDAERLIALEALFDAGFPRLDNKDFGELLWPNHFVAPETRKSYGSRLYRRMQKAKGKNWH